MPVRVLLAESGPADLNVEVQHDLRVQPADAAAIDALIAARPEVGVFASRAWLSGLFAEPPDGCEPALMLFRQGTTLRAVAPLAVREGRTHVRAGLLGGGFGSDRIDLLAARGFEARAADAFLGWMRTMSGRRAFVIQLRDVPAESPLWGAVHRAGLDRRQPLTLQPREVHTLPYLDFAEHERAAASSGDLRQKMQSLERHRRWLERRGRLTVETLHDPDDVSAALQELRALLHLRWHASAAGSVLDEPRVLRFHQATLHRLLDEGRLRMIRLRVEARTAAVFYGLASGRWWGYYLAGYDREWAGRIHLGRITLAAAIDAAAADCAGEFDFLKGAERIKYLWPVRERSTIDADIYSEATGAQLRRATRAGRDAVVAFAKSMRHLVAGPAHGGN
jgi:CelD/BcsL family acetyltransferase involved in cellulose biosynthesis